MSYAIIRNDKLTRVDAQGSYIHNDRRSKGHSNKDIDPTRTHLNFHCKENKLTYIKEFDRIKKEYDLKGNIRSNSIIMCEMMITSDNEFFNKIGLEETKRYFRESYKFVCNYKNLGERNIVSAAVHLDETTPHMHLVYIPVVKTKDKEGKTISMQKNGHTAGFLIDLNLNVTEKDINISTIEFSYEQTEKNGENVNILIKVRDKVNGINKIVPPVGDYIKLEGTKEERGIDASIKVGVEYKYKIISMNGEEKEETVFIEPALAVTIPIINTTTDATNSAEANSIEKGTTLYINFSATMDITGGTITIENKDDGNPVPYAVTKNGIYTFAVTGTYGENKTVTKEVDVIVNQFVGPSLVQYDAGDWTKEKIEELNNKQLYALNSEKTVNVIYRLQNPTNDNALNFTFGGFTYKGDAANQSLIDNGTIVTSRNQSVSPQEDGGTPKYEGWQILENYQKNNKTYVTKLVHAGAPENFVYNYYRSYDSNNAEYLLSSGLRQTSYNKLNDGTKINPRNWQMYVDKNQENLIADRVEKDSNGKEITVKDVHLMDYNEALSITGAENGTDGIRNIGASYWLGNIRNEAILYTVRYDGWIYPHNPSRFDFCLGIRPVVNLKSGVYIKSGSGNEGDPYILAIEEN